MESIQIAEDLQKALSIIEKKEALPKELWEIIEIYQGNQTRTTSNTSKFLNALEDRLLILLVKDIYKPYYKWYPCEIETAMLFFPAVLPASIRGLINQYVKDHRKKLSILEKKDELPLQLRRTIEDFREDRAVTTTNVARDFLDALKERLRRIFDDDIEDLNCQWDAHEFETAMRIFPGVFSIDNLVDMKYPFCPKRFSLVPHFAKQGIDFGWSVIKKLFIFTDNQPCRSAMVDKACLSIIQDLGKTKEFSQWHLDGTVTNLLKIMFEKDEDEYRFRCRFRYLVILTSSKDIGRKLAAALPVNEEYPSRFYFPTYSPGMDRLLAVSSLGDFYYVLDAGMCHFPTELGRLFRPRPLNNQELDYFDPAEEVGYSYICNVHTKDKVDPIVFSLFEEHVAVATVHTKICMLLYAASTKRIPAKFLYFLFRREPHIYHRRSS